MGGGNERSSPEIGSMIWHGEHVPRAITHRAGRGGGQRGETRICRWTVHTLVHLYQTSRRAKLTHKSESPYEIHPTLSVDSRMLFA